VPFNKIKDYESLDNNSNFDTILDMKIFIICSKKFYGEIPPIQEALEKAGHIVFLPNCFDDPRQNKDIETWEMKNILNGRQK
jgi:hypothetical protein